jgi:predicted alpha/beta-hydrolase family hydrolase
MVTAMAAFEDAVPPYEVLRDQRAAPSVHGYLHRPPAGGGDGLVLTHGAGSNGQAPLLVALAEALAAHGFVVLRCDLPYRQVRPHGPPGPGDAARDREGLKNAVAVMRKLAPGRVFLGGHSYGGRQATMLCAVESGLVEGLLLLSYPLHPPRKPEQLRTKHLADLRSPCLFVHGTRDPFGTREEMEQALRLIPAKTGLVMVDGAGHDLNFRKGAAGQDLIEKIVSALQEFTEREPKTSSDPSSFR